MGPKKSDEEEEEAENDLLDADDNLSSSDEFEKIVLRDIDLCVQPGEFVALVGRVGSGKTSLLKSVVNELKVQRGTVLSKGSIACVSQTAFLVNDTLRNNILFGKPYNKAKYEKIIRICQLLPDLEILPSGDSTEIGERGINLSGGQKQRISLARAVYSDSDIYLIDDCLSALDAHVGKAVLEKVILRHLRGKTIIMASHHTHFLDRCDSVYVIKNGTIVLGGSYSEVKDIEEFKELLVEKDKEEVLGLSGPNSKRTERTNQLSQRSRDLDNEHLSAQSPRDKTSKTNEILAENQNEAGRLTKEEHRSQGIVGFDVILFYIKNGSWLIFLVTIAFFTSSIVLTVTIEWWPAQWYKDSFRLTKKTYISIYFSLIITFLASSMLKGLIYSLFASKSSYRIFKKMVWNLLRKPLGFFDTTPSGVIINRMVDDLETVDLDFSREVFNLMNYLFMFLASFSLMLGASILLVSCVIVTALLMVYIFKRYLLASTELKRIFRLSRSPVLSTVSEMVNGVSQIKLYKFENSLFKKWEYYQEITINSQIHEGYSLLWVLLCVYTTFAFIALLIGSVFFIKKQSGMIDADSSVGVGLVMQYVVSLTSLVYNFSLSLGQFMTELCVVERLKEYFDFSGFEAEFDQKKDAEIDQNWPEEQGVEIKNLSIRYREGLPLVIKNLDLEIKAGQKAAILGRTGSGKSTLMLSLMRIIEASFDDEGEKGEILITGVDIAKLGLHRLRKGISIIPQDPNLLKGTLRFNVDNFDMVSNNKIISALQRVSFFETLSSDQIEEVRMKQQHRASAKKTNREGSKSLSERTSARDTPLDLTCFLSMEIEAKGANLSVGQRQLICIAKALVQDSKILLMDEATASIDKKLDQLIQRVIMDQMEDRTVITIAHRLETIIGYDKVVILSDGSKIEEGSPQELMELQGEFYSMMLESGITGL